MFGSENAGNGRLPRTPEVLPRAAVPWSRGGAFFRFFPDLLPAYDSLGISQSMCRHGRAHWASGRPEVPESSHFALQKQPPGPPQERPKSAPRRSLGCSSCLFRNHRIPLAFYRFLELSWTPQSLFRSPGRPLACSQSRFGRTGILFPRPGASRGLPGGPPDASGASREASHLPPGPPRGPKRGLRRASSEHLKTLRELPKTLQLRRLPHEAPQGCPGAQKATQKRPQTDQEITAVSPSPGAQRGLSNLPEGL